MNGRKAKRLRSEAEEATIGLPDYKYEMRALNRKKPSRLTRFLVGCTRSYYRALKAQ